MRRKIREARRRKCLEAHPVGRCTYSSRILQGKWGFDTKADGQGTTTQYRARWVICGNCQRPGYDYDEAYAPVALDPSVKLIFAKQAQTTSAHVSGIFSAGHERVRDRRLRRHLVCLNFGGNKVFRCRRLARLEIWLKAFHLSNIGDDLLQETTFFTWGSWGFHVAYVGGWLDQENASHFVLTRFQENNICHLDNMGLRCRVCGRLARPRKGWPQHPAKRQCHFSRPEV